MTVVRVLIKVLVVAIFALAIGHAVWPTSDLILLVALGRAPQCAVLDAAKASIRHYNYENAASRIVRQSRYEVRDKDGYSLLATPSGPFWEPAMDGAQSEVLAQLAEIESKYSVGAVLPVRPGDVVLDCGANVGVFTREAARRGAALVVAIEPVPRNIECIRRNLRGEIASGQVVVYTKGVWDREDVLPVYESKRDSAEDSFVRTEGSKPGASLPLTTLDKIASELHLDRVDFIKMDIEGAEPKALAGGARMLARFHPRLEVEVSGNEREVSRIARNAWPGYHSACLTCDLDRTHKSLYPTLINLSP